MADCFKVRERGDADTSGENKNPLARLFSSSRRVDRQEQNKQRKVEAITKQLAGALDVDFLGKSFGRFAGSDELMDPEEFDRFTKESNMTRQQAANLWLVLDRDGSGEVSREEFTDAITNMFKARAWLRYCPDCIYQNTCAYCMETNANCQICTENAFCASCWADHPSRHRVDADEGDGQGAKARALSTADQIRTQLVIRPLHWAYTSPMMAWLPVAQKATLRQVLRAQQQAVADSVEKARREEEAAMAAMR